ncbi:MAG TPA: PQQ-binding-like beta-propeller repeat protein [Thermoguttaceae bacterium]|nr:PQQ-binding-like beta-propeller repeat protein [Thermoguttaceae bacterium]
MNTNNHRQKRATTRSNELQTAGLLVFCTSAVLGTAAPVGAQLADSAWPDYGGGYANQHCSPNRGPAGDPTVLWTFDLQGIGAQGFQKGFHQPILLPDGTIVLNTADSSDDQIVALNPDGTFRWRFDESSLGPWLAADQNDQIYTIRHTYGMSSSARLRAVNFEGGAVWTTSLPGSNPTQNGPAVGRDGNVYAAVDFSALQAISSSGAVDWSYASAGYYDNPAVADDGTIYIGGDGLKALAPDGRLLWSYPVRTEYGHNPRYLSPAIGDDGTVFAGQTSTVSNLVALDNATGKAIWTRPDLDGTPAIGPDGTVYVVPESGLLHALDPADGATLWTYLTGKTDYYNSEGVTIDVGGNLYISNDQGLVTALSPEGQLRWSLDLAPEISGFVGLSAPVIGPNETLYIVGGNTGKVFAIAPEPSTLALLGVGASGLAAFGWRRRRKHRRSQT